MNLRDFRTGWRVLARQPFQSVVELFGLAVGFAICFLLLGFARFSFNYDSDVPDRERVFVIKHRLNFIPQPQWMEYTPFALREVAQRSGLPLEVSAWWPRKVTVRLHGVQQEVDVTVVDPSFERIAGLHALEGDLQQALTRPDGLAVTRDAARRVFGEVHVLGRTLNVSGQTVQVRAILPDRPDNSTLQFGVLVGVGSSLWPEQERREALANWMGIAGRIYVKTEAGASPQALQKVLQDVIDRAPWAQLATPEMKAALGERKLVDIALGPLTEAYFDRSVAGTMGTGPRGDKRLVLAMAGAGLLILALAVISYVNLAAMRVMRRQREIAVRRVLGATTQQLLSQFMVESVLVATTAAALGALLAWLLAPLASDLLARPLAGIFTPATVAACILSGVVTGIAAGIYPGWLAHGVNMGEALTHRSGETAGGAWLRRVLTAVQFAAAMAMGAVALAILWQTRFAAAAPPGFDPKPLLVVQMNDGIDQPKARGFRDAVARLPGVAAVTDSFDVPGHNDGTGTRGSEGVKRMDGSSAALTVHFVGPDFFDVYGLKAQAGRVFDPRTERSPGQEESNVVLNQAAVRALGWNSSEEAVGQRINGSRHRVVGVAPDILWDTLRDPVRPMMYQVATDSRLLTIRMDGEADAASLDQSIAATASRYFERPLPFIRPAASFYADAYAEDLRVARMLGCATLIVLTMAAFGVYAMAAVSVQRRAREIVLRKLHGAGSGAIAALVGREFLLVTGAAAVIGLPVAVLGIQRYMAPFVERSPLGGWAPMVALVLAVVIVTLASARHTVTAMRVSPVRALRD